MNKELIEYIKEEQNNGCLPVLHPLPYTMTSFGTANPTTFLEYIPPEDPNALLTKSEIDACIEVAKKRNEGKTQFFSRGWPSVVKHSAGFISERICEKHLGAKIDYEIRKSGDKSKPDGLLPSGKSLLIKSVCRLDIKNVYIPIVCTDNAKPTDFIVAIRVLPILLPSGDYKYTDISFLGYVTVEEFLQDGKLNTTHYDAKASIPGKSLDRDKCTIYPINKLKPIGGLLK